MGKQLFAQLVRDDALGLAAELAYRFFLAVFPFFVFLASVGAFFPTGSIELISHSSPVPRPLMGSRQLR